MPYANVLSALRKLFSGSVKVFRKLCFSQNRWISGGLGQTSPTDSPTACNLHEPDCLSGSSLPTCFSRALRSGSQPNGLF
ncbi:hypothetical protein AOLI_G00074630 [Acnodon oligacanthus]